MKLSFKKNHSKPTVLTFFRTDGSSTWSKIKPGLEDHDIAHWAVESILEYQNAFYGLINQGFTVADFEAPRDVRPAALMSDNLPMEALLTEYIVSLLQTQRWNSGSDEEYLPILRQTLLDKELPFPEKLSEKTLILIKQRYEEQSGKWYLLPAGEVLVLELTHF